MGFFSSVDRNDDDSYRAFPNREKRKDCPECQGLGKVIEHVVVRNRDGSKDTIRERIKCRKCKGSGLK